MGLWQNARVMFNLTARPCGDMCAMEWEHKKEGKYLPDIALGFRSEKRWTIEKNETWSVIFG